MLLKNYALLYDMNKISAVIVVKDNPPHISETLSSLSFVDEIIIVDIGIDQQCRNIVEEVKNVKIKKINEPITYVEQIRERSKSFTSHSKILFLDPDEVVSEGLREELLQNINHYDYIKIPRKNLIFDKWIQHSRWWPDYQIRLFNKEAVHWPEKLHAQPEVSGNGYTIDASETKALLHYNYESMAEYIQKMSRYAQAEANEHHLGKVELTLTTSMKRGLQEFISRYFAEKGYKDGMHGTVLAFLQMFYYLLVYFFYWEKNKNAVPPTQMQALAITNHFKQTLYEATYWIEKEKLGSQAERIKNKILNSLLKRI